MAFSPDQRMARVTAHPADPEVAPVLSVVIPCLNEVETIGSCIEKALSACDAAGIPVEIIVADNGSTDGSVESARHLGARIVTVTEKGYGQALMGGIQGARGEYILMGDADDSYDFGEAPRFVAQLDAGYDLVQGCRLPGGGGTIRPGAMPFLHRWWGNPMFSALARWWFKAPVHDVYCGLRAFRRDLVPRLDLRCTGMEFALEMIVKASMHGARLSEVPITLWPDGRRGRRPHLRTFRDGWRSLRFFLLFSPRWLFLVPGTVLVLAGLLAYGLVFFDVRLGGVRFDAHSLLFGSLAIILGCQAILFAVLTKTYAVTSGLLPPDGRLERFFHVFTLERGLLAGALATAAGLVLLMSAILDWRAVGFGDLDYARTMRRAIPGTVLVALGVQGVLFSFFTSVLGLHRR